MRFDGHNGGTRLGIPPSDVELMARLAAGNTDALADLYDRHAAAVFGLTRAILRDARIAEEATHDVFLGLWQRPDRYEPARGPFIGWLLRVARNRAIDLLRRDREQPFTAAASTEGGVETDPAERLVDPDPNPADQAFALVQREEIRRAIAELTSEQQRLLGLAYFEGLTQREIAARVNRPLGTVKTQIRTAMQRLARVMAATDPDLADRWQSRSEGRISAMSEHGLSVSTGDGGATTQQ
jgi:RNA polymerase sigma-70 factor (ECF subfamily)